jgi:hypothetical protein
LALRGEFGVRQRHTLHYHGNDGFGRVSRVG